MASFETEGLDRLINLMERLGTMTDDIAEDLLFEGGDILVKHLKNNIVRAGHVDQGDMLLNVGFRRRVKKRLDGARQITIYSLTKAGQSKGKRLNAYKAFWANYGTSKQPGTRFWDKAVQEATPEIEEAQTQIMKNYLHE